MRCCPLQCKERGRGERQHNSKPYFLSWKNHLCHTKVQPPFLYSGVSIQISPQMTPACQWRWSLVTTFLPYYLEALTRVHSINYLSLHINPLLWSKKPIYKCSRSGPLCRSRPTWIRSMPGSWWKGEKQPVSICQHNYRQFSPCAYWKQIYPANADWLTMLSWHR